jgi:hypothetical protein
MLISVVPVLTSFLYTEIVNIHQDAFSCSANHRFGSGLFRQYSYLGKIFICHYILVCTEDEILGTILLKWFNYFAFQSYIFMLL